MCNKRDENISVSKVGMAVRFVEQDGHAILNGGHLKT